jgi:hypothetical protein
MPLILKGGKLVWYNGGLAYDVDLCDCVCGGEPPEDCCTILAGIDWQITFSGYTWPCGNFNMALTIPYGPDCAGAIGDGCTWQDGDMQSCGECLSLFYYNSGKIEVVFQFEEIVYRWELDPATCDDMEGPTVLDEVSVPAGTGSCTIQRAP